jgi:quercetin dioxygenase-like cupin family protein
MTPEAPNLLTLAASVTDRHFNTLVGLANDHCVRLAVMEDQAFPWHRHPGSDELFIVIEGELTVEFRDRPAAVLKAGDLVAVPANVEHRTIARGRTVNLCVEATQAETVFS